MEAPTICEQFRFVGVECLASVSNGITKAKTRISLLPRTVAWRVGSHEQRLFTAGRTSTACYNVKQKCSSVQRRQSLSLVK